MRDDTIEKIERQISEKIIDDALAAGLSISIDDGEEVVLRRSTDRKAILAAMFTTDADYLHLVKDDKPLGSVLLVWGNGFECIADNSISINEYLVGAEKLAEKLAAEYR